MKTLKMVGVGLLLALLPVMAYATVAEIWSTTASKDCFSVSCSSSTATLVLDANTHRVGWMVSNPSSSYSVILATSTISAATGATTGGAWHSIPPLSSYYEDVNPYLGAIYILTPSGVTAIVISGEEREK